MKNIILVFFVFSAIGWTTFSDKTPADYVNVFIGTKTPGHTYPGATLPFGMVQLSPDTRNDHTSWPASAGYDYTDTSIIGFTHTHLSGTGVPDLGDILFMPTIGKIQTEAGSPENTTEGYRSLYRHENETAEPGYYSVLLEDYNIKAELTTTLRTGLHRYSFPKTVAAHIIIDLEHRDPVIESELTIISDTEIAGYRRSKAWAGNQRQYFVAKFSKPIISYQIVNGKTVVSRGTHFNDKKIIAALNFDASEKQVLVQVGLSAVSIEGARKNIEAEFANWDFEKVKADAKKIWNQSLGKIIIKDTDEDRKKIFYTSLYHSLLTPNLYSDVDGGYRGMDDDVHKAEGFNNYTVFSLWDTFRALHPLLTIIEPQITRDIVVTLQKKYEQFGELPMWELAANDTRCMIGYHAVSVMADAYVKGITNFDVNKVLESMIVSANVKKRGINYYTELGYVPTNKSSQSVSKTLEYAYDDWCIAQMAKAIGNEKVYDEFSKRARFFTNLFDKETKFMRPKNSDGTWYQDFDPTSVGNTYNFNFTEGNSYQYSLFVPHDIATLIDLVGGESKFDKWLDNLFNKKMQEDVDSLSDVSGLIGQYAHGNEPSHHIAYLYNFIGKPWKTQEKVYQILNELYTSKADGLCGNDDAGQMSAWYVLSSLGFYSVTPGSPYYIIGSPSFAEASINLDNGKTFTIKGNNVSKENIYFSSLTLNGKPYPYSYLKHDDILKGGELVFEMTNKPNKEWATSIKHRPISDTQNTVSNPFIKSDYKDFLIEKKVELGCNTPNAVLYYTVDGSEPTQKSIKYSSPFTVKKTTILKVKAFQKELLSSYTVSILLEKLQSVSNMQKSQLKKGLNYGYYEGIFRSVYDFSRELAVKKGVVNEVAITDRLRDEWIGFDFNGYIEIPKDGNYTFEVAANDGAQLLIDGKELFESDGRKSFAFTQKNNVILSKGLHQFEVKYFQCSDNIGLNVFWEGPGFKRVEIPASAFFRKE